MRFLRHKPREECSALPWSAEYRLRLLHMPTPEGTCTGCSHDWEHCPTLDILNTYGNPHEAKRV